MKSNEETLQKSDWDKLSPKNQHRISNLIDNESELQSVSLLDKDTRDCAHYNRIDYGVIEIIFKKSNKMYRTTVSRQHGGQLGMRKS